MNIDAKTKQELVNRINQSEEFRNSQVYQNLLTYLVNAAIENNVPKETTIAMELFGKDPDFNSNKDATVRYHVHYLRKKLEAYYQNEGTNDSVRILIPKGHYEVKFTENAWRSNGRAPQWKLKSPQTFVVGALSLVVVVLLIMLATSKQVVPSQNGSYAPDVREDAFWSGFFANRNETLIVLGDDYLIDEHRSDLERYRIIRDWEIDSDSDLRTFLQKYPGEEVRRSELTAVPYGGVQNIIDLVPVFFDYGLPLNVKMSSSLSLDDIKDHNVIYIGEFKNLRILRQILNKTPIRYQYEPDERVFLLNVAGDTVKTFVRLEAPYESKDKFNVDYSLLVNLPGLASEHLMFVVGFGYGGRLERTSMIGNLTKLDHFRHAVIKKHGAFPDYFIAMFEVKSIERTGFDSQLCYFQKIPESYFSSSERFSKETVSSN